MPFIVIHVHKIIAGDGDVISLVNQLKELIMNYQQAFREYVAAQTAFNERNAVAVDSLVESNKGLTEDVAELKRLIGDITPEDAASLEAAKAKASAVSDKLESVAAALKSLDDATPPAPAPVADETAIRHRPFTQ